MAAPAMPRDTLTSRPRPGREPVGPAVAGPSRRTGSISPPWKPRPGYEEAEPGCHGPDRLELGRGGRTDDQPDRPAGPPGRHVACHAQVERLGRGAPGRVGGDFEVLEFAGIGVRRPAQDVRVAVRPFDQWRNGPAAEVRADGHGIRAQPVEQRARVVLGRQADVAALGIDDDGQIGRDRRPDPFEGRQSSRPMRLIERDIGLDRGSIWSGSLHDEPGKPLDAGQVSREAVGQRGWIGIQTETQHAADRLTPRGQPLEVWGGHEGEGASLGGTLGGTLGAGVGGGS